MKEAILFRLTRAFFVSLFALTLVISFNLYQVEAATTCTQTDFYRDGINMTAALVNPVGLVTGTVDATGCNIGVYFGPGATGTVDGAEIYGANYFGVVNDGGAVNVTNSSIHDIGESPLGGSQHGVGVYFTISNGGTGSISGNTIFNYQKGGIVVNGIHASATIQNNTVTGQGPVAYIAQNGIQVGYGATANVTENTVTGNAYTGSSTVSGGIIVVGGPYYGESYTINTVIKDNVVRNNDIGVFLSNLAADGSAPTSATNIKVIHNTISSDAVTNGLVYQAGVSDVGNGDKIVNNTISGDGYDNALNPCIYQCIFAIDADASFTNNAKVHANK
jgi:hypothetical protein